MTSGTADLRDVLPAEGERAAPDYAIDGAAPRIAQQPGTREEVARLLASATEAGLAVVPQGNRTALDLGRPIDRYDVALDMRGLDGIVDYEPADMTVQVEAGMTLRALRAHLAEHGQYLPADTPPGDEVTIGGLLATARPGAWRGHVPAARDLVIGMEVALPDGSLVSSGGRVVKNVSGYDLHRLHTGSLGTLGVILGASFKLVPLPPATRSFAVRRASVRDAARLATELRDAALPARALSVLAPEAATALGFAEHAHVLLELAGYESAIDAATRRIRALAEGSGGGVDDAPPGAWERLRALAGSPDGVVLRLGVPATRIAATIEAARGLGATAWGHIASGSVVVHAPAIDVTSVRVLRRNVEAGGGFLIVESGPPAVRAVIDPLGAGAVALVRSLKQQFDPTGTLSPGRWEPGL
ncbi:MAG: FAD-binding oxidoreductase [Chloroflexi bacterium]|nr:FAD-binding oxidoreductase [Chloroflexota bacterium]